MFDRTNVDDPLTFGLVLVMLVFDLILLVLLTGYVEAVNPGAQGVPEKPWFPFTVSFSACPIYISCKSTHFSFSYTFSYCYITADILLVPITNGGAPDDGGRISARITKLLRAGKSS